MYIFLLRYAKTSQVLKDPLFGPMEISLIWEVRQVTKSSYRMLTSSLIKKFVSKFVQKKKSVTSILTTTLQAMINESKDSKPLPDHLQSNSSTMDVGNLLMLKSVKILTTE